MQLGSEQFSTEELLRHEFFLANIFLPRQLLLSLAKCERSLVLKLTADTVYLNLLTFCHINNIYGFFKLPKAAAVTTYLAYNRSLLNSTTASLSLKKEALYKNRWFFWEEFSKTRGTNLERTGHRLPNCSKIVFTILHPTFSEKKTSTK